ncbi:hypothetical protein [Halosimplex halobium]|uniref:hypothetical protein n=1 Tax=Halosimplex halobium TaxID=3396618 RepID=UPI003F574D5C
MRPLLSQEIAYGPNQIGVTHDGDHLIYVPAREKTVLLDFDTGEVVDDDARIKEVMSYVPETQRVGSAVELDEETMDQLSDLGYA